MKLVIDIPEEMRTAIEQGSFGAKYNIYDLVGCVMNGAPLPKDYGWIPVSERLPEEFESVLVCYKSQGGMAQAVSERFGTHTGYRWSALAGIEPTAWMPLPEPYKVDKGEQ